jgi:predicted small secreted protein
MKKKHIFIPSLVLMLLVGTLAACSNKHESKGEVIKKTTTTIERPVTEETQTTTTTTERK